MQYTVIYEKGESSWGLKEEGLAVSLHSSEAGLLDIPLVA